MEKRVLSRTLIDALEGRKIRFLLFTTYSFEPDFFEQEILSDFFDRGFSQDQAVRRVQMSYVLREGVEIEVYYDDAFFNDATASSRLDLVRIPIRAANAAFHPKVVLALVEGDQGARSLVVMSASANLTRAGWWDNIECAHVVRLEDGELTGLRKGLLYLLDRIRKLDKSRTAASERPCWTAIRTFVSGLEEDKKHSDGLHFYASGLNKDFIEFLYEHVKRHRVPWNLEIVSPFFAGDANNDLHGELAKQLNVKETLLLLPLDEKQQALCTKAYLDVIKKAAGVSWAAFKDDAFNPKKGESYRKLHAKVYRFYSREQGEEWIFTGSVNFTRMAVGSRNIEAGCLVKVLRPSFSPMLAPISADAEVVTVPKLDKEPRGDRLPLIVLKYHWGDRKLSAWSEKEVSFTVMDSAGAAVAAFPGLKGDDWTEDPKADLARLEQSLRNSSLITVRVADHSRTVMVQETAMNNKPSLLAELSPRQVLELWATLDPEKRLQLVALAMEVLLQNEISPEFRESGYTAPQGSFFSQFSEIFQSFMRLRRHLEGALSSQLRKEFDYYLYGRDIDSLPSLIGTVSTSEEFDPVLKYLIGLCARQVVDSFSSCAIVGPEGKMAAESLAANGRAAKGLREGIESLLSVREYIPLEGFKGEAAAFFTWYEDAFLTWAGEEVGA